MAFISPFSLNEAFGGHLLEHLLLFCQQNRFFFLLLTRKTACPVYLSSEIILLTRKTACCYVFILSEVILSETLDA